MTPGEYTQLTGRAGRRGIDVEGHAVVLWQPGLDPEAVAGLASTRTYPLRSSFRPTYNMAVNLVGQVGRARAREILETSFAQFQADRAVVGLARQARRQEEALAGYAEAMTCHLGRLRRVRGAAAADRRAGDRAVPSGFPRPAGGHPRLVGEASPRRRHPDSVGAPGRLGRRHRPGDDTGVTGASADGADRRTAVASAVPDRRPGAVEPLTRVPVPKSFNSRDPASRRDLASTVRDALGAVADAPAPRRPRRRGEAADDETLAGLRAQSRSHPCHGCADREDHARWAERWWRLRRETDALVRRIEGRTNTIARVFDRVCDLLTERGYLLGDTVTAHGKRLRRLYAESDLLVSECLREGIWSGLDGPGLAACVSAVVYESRREDGALEPRLPPGPVRGSPARDGADLVGAGGPRT